MLQCAERNRGYYHQLRAELEAVQHQGARLVEAVARWAVVGGAAGHVTTSSPLIGPQAAAGAPAQPPGGRRDEALLAAGHHLALLHQHLQNAGHQL